MSLTYASDDIIQLPGVFIDDVVVSTGAGTTSFEDDGDVMDGWAATGAPEGSPGNENTWTVGGAADVPAPVGASVDASFARHGEVLDFLSATFGPYPFATAGGIVDDDPDLGFALENQTRPIYSTVFFDAPRATSASSSTSSHTSGTATASPSSSGSTSGSTRASRRTPSGSWRSTRATAPRRRSSTSSTTSSRRTTRSGRRHR